MAQELVNVLSHDICQGWKERSNTLFQPKSESKLNIVYFVEDIEGQRTNFNKILLLIAVII